MSMRATVTTMPIATFVPVLIPGEESEAGFWDGDTAAVDSDVDVWVPPGVPVAGDLEADVED